MKLRALNQVDFYKTGHKDQYPENTTEVYSNLTARSGRLSNVNDSKGVYFVGIQLFVKNVLIDLWNDTFFNMPKDEVISHYKRRVSVAMSKEITVDHIEALHDLGYLPLRLKALPEGSFVPYKIPLITMVNTHPDFAWVTNMLESVISAETWQPITTATTYKAYLNMFEKYAEITGSDKEFVPFQGHDFSYRGMSGMESAAKSAFACIAMGAKGTDSVPGIDIAEDYYRATGFIAGSVSATEHSVMCAGKKESEYNTFKRLITDVYPTGIVSLVSDTWDFWKVVRETLPELKTEIMNRDGKLVIRPDSGDPVDIICGKGCITVPDEYLNDWKGWVDKKLKEHGGTITQIFNVSGAMYNVNYTPRWDSDEKELNYCTFEELRWEHEDKGLIECLWDTFGGTINAKGYKVLDSHIGAIYGDSITLERQEEILQRLKKKGFASSNIVLGIGSYSLQYNTRDTHGIAIKATSVVVNGERRDIFKDPKTDDGTKKSAKGLLMVSYTKGGGYTLKDECTSKEEKRGCLRTIFEDGQKFNELTLDDVIKNSVL